MRIIDTILDAIPGPLEYGIAFGLLAWLILCFAPDETWGQAKVKPNTVVIVCADWCAPCRDLKKSTLVDKNVKAELAKYTVYHVDYDRYRQYATRYKVKVLPTILVGRLEGRQWTEVDRRVGFVGAEEFSAWLRRDK